MDAIDRAVRRDSETEEGAAAGRMIAAADDPPLSLRLPADLFADITAAAARAGRSRNSEILVRLRQTFALERV